MARLVFVCASIVCGLLSGAVRAGDPSPFGSVNPPHAETYVKAGNLTGEIIDITPSGQLTLRVRWMKPQVQRSSGNRYRGRSSSRSRRPTIKMVPQTDDVKLTLIPGVRIKSQIPLAQSGEKQPLTGADLQKGHIIAAVTVRSRSNPKQLSIHTAMILGHSTGGSNPSAKKK